MNGNQITSDLLLALPRRFPLSFFWRNNRIDAMAAGRDGRTRRVQAGIDGQADITGVVLVPSYGVGVRVEIEAKGKGDRQSVKQMSFQVAIEKAGGIYLLAFDPEEALNELELKIQSL